jgi:hypothetical protein
VHPFARSLLIARAGESSNPPLFNKKPKPVIDRLAPWGEARI